MGRIAGICFCILITAHIATGQPASETTTTERTYAHGDRAPQRHVQTRSESAGREVLVETFDAPDIEGRMAPTRASVTETIRTAPNAVQTRQDVFWFPEGRRTLLETTGSLQETLANGDFRVVHHTSAPDLNGRLRETSRLIEETRSASPDVHETYTTLLVPDINDTLRAAERTEYAEHLINPGLLQRDSTQLVRDVNGRWQPVEVRRGEVRIVASERTEEETIQRPDINGRLAVEERNVIRRSNTNGQEQVVIETHARYADGFSPLALSQRVRRTTTATADGGSSTVEEVESRSPAAPADPMRVTRRTVTTVRQIDAGRWVTERQEFERDINGRLRLIASETEERVR